MPQETFLSNPLLRKTSSGFLQLPKSPFTQKENTLECSRVFSELSLTEAYQLFGFMNHHHFSVRGRKFNCQ